jgi:creatinine amidohydrolase
MKSYNHDIATMTNLQVADYLKRGGTTVLVPAGATEQHGPYGPIGTDRFIAQEVCRRVAPDLNALVAPAIPYGLSITHKGAPGLIYVKIESYMAYVQDVVLALNEAGFRRIIFLNGHYDNAAGITYGIRSIYDRLAPGTFAFCVNYWEAMKPEDAATYLGWEAGLHANIGEVSVMMALDPDSVDMTEAVAGWPSPPADIETDPFSATLAAILPIPGSMLKVTPTGGWGDPSQATAEKGEAYLQVITRAVIRFVRDVVKTYETMFETPAGRDVQVAGRR